LFAEGSLYLPKSFNFVNAFVCYKQKCKLAPLNLACHVTVCRLVSNGWYS